MGPGMVCEAKLLKTFLEITFKGNETLRLLKRHGLPFRPPQNTAFTHANRKTTETQL